MTYELLNPTDYSFGEFVPELAKYVFDCPKGIGLRFEFANGYGASVVKNEMSYGREDDLWELAVLNLKTQGLDHSTPITNDVLGSLSDEEVENVLRQIRDLPSILN